MTVQCCLLIPIHKLVCAVFQNVYHASLCLTCALVCVATKLKLKHYWVGAGSVLVLGAFTIRIF